MEQQQTAGLAGQSQQHAYPASDEKDTYGIVVDDRLGSPVIRLGLDTLMRRKDPERVVFLCLAPHDVRQRTDWQDLQQHLRGLRGKQPEVEVRIVDSPEELLDLSMEMRVIMLPADGRTMGY